MVLRWFRSDNCPPRRLPWVVLALVLAAGWSTSGLIFRHIEHASAPQVIFYRSLCLTFAVTAFVAWRYRIATPRAFRAVGWPGIVGALGLGLASVTFIMAIERTTIANISFLIAAAPFFVGVLAWTAMGEAMSRRTQAATAMAMVGVAAMVWEGFAFGTWDGNLLALACALLSSFYIVAVRFGQRIDMVPTVALSGVVAAVTAAAMTSSFAIGWHDLALCVLQGIFVSALCNGLFTLCARHLPAAELTVLSMIESVLSPIWVLIAFAEVPTGLTIAGGGIVLAAVAFQALRPAGQRRRHGA